MQRRRVGWRHKSHTTPRPSSLSPSFLPSFVPAQPRAHPPPLHCSQLPRTTSPPPAPINSLLVIALPQPHRRSHPRTEDPAIARIQRRREEQARSGRLEQLLLQGIMDPSAAFQQQHQQPQRSSSNVSLSSLVRTGSGGGGARGRGGATRGRRMVRRVCRGVITFIFAIAGLFLGAVTGGLIGLATESGLFRGTGIGAITGALVSIEVVDSSIRLWQARRSGIWSILYVLNVIYSLLTGRLVREKVDPAVQRVVRSQMNAVDSSPFRESPDLFEVEATNGMPRASIDRLPESWITEEYKRDAVGDQSGCSVCLQDFQVGEKVRSLPDCWHVFHVPCIDGWLIKHGSCPLCRRKL